MYRRARRPSLSIPSGNAVHLACRRPGLQRERACFASLLRGLQPLPVAVPSDEGVREAVRAALGPASGLSAHRRRPEQVPRARHHRRGASAVDPAGLHSERVRRGGSRADGDAAEHAALVRADGARLGRADRGAGGHPDDEAAAGGRDRGVLRQSRLGRGRCGRAMRV